MVAGKFKGTAFISPEQLQQKLFQMICEVSGHQFLLGFFLDNLLAGRLPWMTKRMSSSRVVAVAAMTL
jgi:hypothetical protein